MIVLIPVFILLKLVEGICNLAQLLSGWVFRLLGLVMLTTAVCCFLFQMEEIGEVIRMGIAGISVFLLPMVGELLIAGIVILEMLVKRAMEA